MARLVIVGNATHDLNRTGLIAARQPGGTLLYATLALDAMGHEVRPIGYAPLRAYLTLRLTEVDRTGLHLAFPGTRFLNEYDGQQREQWARQGSGKAIEDASLLDDAEGVLLGPVLREVPADLTLPLGVPSLLDVQGTIRRLSEETTLLGYHRVEIDTEGLTLPRATHVRGSIEEVAPIVGTDDPEAAAKALSKRTGAPAIVTLGPDGALAYDGEALHRAQLPAVEVEDPTGAGDVFDAGLLHALVEGEGLEQGLALACAVAGLFLANVADEVRFRDRFPSLDAVEARAEDARK